MPRFELRKGGTRTDCEVTVDRNRLHVRTMAFGKREKHESSSKYFKSNKAALAELDVMVAGLIGKGYVQLGADGKPARVAKPAAAAKPTRAAKSSKGLDALGPLAEHAGMLELEWERGTVTRARLAAYCEAPGPMGEAVFGMLLACPAFRSMRAFTLGTIDERGLGDYSFFLRKLAAVDSVPPLEELFLGDFSDDWSEVAWVKLGNLGTLWALLPKLTKLTLRGGARMSLGTIRHDALEQLVIRTSEITKPNIQKLASAKCSALETLAVSCQNTDALIRPFSTAQVVKQLVKLDLSNGGLTDAGAAALLANRAAFEHLELIDLRNNALTPTAKKSLTGWKAVRV